MDSDPFIPKGRNNLTIESFQFIEKKFDFLRMTLYPALMVDKNTVLYTLIITILWSCTASISLLYHKRLCGYDNSNHSTVFFF